MYKSVLAMRVIVKYLIAFPLIAIFCSCSNLFDSGDYDVKKASASPNFIVPLAHGSLSIVDAIDHVKDVELLVYPENDLIYLNYRDSSYSKTAEELFALNNTINEFNHSVPIPSGVKSATSSEQDYPPVPLTSGFNFPDKKLSEIKFKTTELVIEYSPSSQDVGALFDIIVRFPNLKLNGQVLTKRIKPFESANIALTDYVFGMTDNVFELEVVLVEKVHDQEINIDNGSANILLQFNSIDFKYIKGNLGRARAPRFKGGLELSDVGQAFKDIDASFESAKITFTVHTGLGVPTSLNFDLAEANNEQGDKVNFILTPTNPIQLNTPTIIGETASTGITVSNAKEVFKTDPKNMLYDVSADIIGEVGDTHFCADTSRIKVDFEVELPFHGIGKNIILRDTVKVSLKDIESSKIEEAFLIINSENEIPLDAALQIYLADGNTEIFDSLFVESNNTLIKGSVRDANGDFQSSGIVNTEISIPTEKINNIFKAKKLVIKAMLQTSSSGDAFNPVKLKSKEKMNINMAFRARLNLLYDGN